MYDAGLVPLGVEGVIVPQAAPVHPVPVTVQLTVVLLVLVTVASKGERFWPAATVNVGG